ncbi:MAG: MTH1187 family thiamine-binding protein [Candidatus Glassbacteria bacterium]
MLAQMSLFPLGKTSGMSKDVARVIELIEQSGLPYQLTAMGTLIEGEWDEVMELVGRCRRKLLEEHKRIYMVLKVDDQPGVTGKLAGKVRSVEEKLGHPAKK